MHRLAKLFDVLGGYIFKHTLVKDDVLQGEFMITVLNFCNAVSPLVQCLEILTMVQDRPVYSFGFFTWSYQIDNSNTYLLYNGSSN